MREPKKLQSAFAMKQFENWMLDQIDNEIILARKELITEFAKNNPNDNNPEDRIDAVDKLQKGFKKIVDRHFEKVRKLIDESLIDLGVANSELQVQDLREAVSDAQEN